MLQDEFADWVKLQIKNRNEEVIEKGELAIDMDFSSAVFSWREWTVTVRGTTAYGLPTILAWRVNFRVAVSTGNYVYDSISGPKHRIDISFSAAGGGSARSTSTASVWRR